jgi:hypothetical protein
MGRHAKLADREALFKAFEDNDEPIRPAGKHPFRWIAKVPLLPTVAGVAALGVVLAAYGTQQISLNFSDGDGPSPADAPDSQAQPPPPDPRAPDATAQGSRASRGAGRAGAVSISFRTTSTWADGFEGRATIVNVSGRPIDGWTFAFRIPNAKVQSIWEVQVVKSGSPVVVRNPPQSPTIAPGGIVQLGFTARGAAGAPSACTFNGVRCRTAAT